MTHQSIFNWGDFHLIEEYITLNEKCITLKLFSQVHRMNFRSSNEVQTDTLLTTNSTLKIYKTMRAFCDTIFEIILEDADWTRGS